MFFFLLGVWDETGRAGKDALEERWTNLASFLSIDVRVPVVLLPGFAMTHRSPPPAQRYESRNEIIATFINSDHNKREEGAFFNCSEPAGRSSNIIKHFSIELLDLFVIYILSLQVVYGSSNCPSIVSTFGGGLSWFILAGVQDAGRLCRVPHTWHLFLYRLT